MPRPILIALVAFLAIPIMARADEPKPSPAVKRILEDTARKVRTNRQAFDKANEKPLGEARKALEELSTTLIKDGKAEEATAVLKQVGTLEADVMRMANAPDEQPHLSPDLRQILEKVMAELKKNRQEFDEANEKPLADARKALEGLSTRLIKDGKAKEATVVLNQLSTLDAAVARLANAPAPVKDAVKPGAQKPLWQRLAGKWHRGKASYHVFKADGTAEHWLTREERVYTEGKYAVKQDGIIEVLWQSGHKWQGRFDGDETIVIEETVGGKATGAEIVLKLEK